MSRSQKYPRLLDGADLMWLSLSALCALLYPVLRELAPLPPGDGWVVFKCGSILLLALVALRRRRAGSLILGTGLLAHGFGDFAIVFQPLEVALLGFLAGHLAYIWLLTRETRLHFAEWSAARKLTAGLLVAWFVVFLLGFLMPSLDGLLRLAVPVYALALLGVALLGLRARIEGGFLPLGTLLYVASDSLIGWDLFVGELAWSDLLTWPLYYVGQLLIVVALVFARRRHARRRS